MLQTSLSPSPLAPVPGGDDLLDNAGPLAGAHVLVIGHGALETVCGLIRRGCTAASELQVGSRLAPEAESADAVIVPYVGSCAEAGTAITLAGRALIMGGRIVIRETTGRLRREVAALLRAHGFCAIEAHPTADGTVLTAERPIFGPLHRS